MIYHVLVVMIVKIPPTLNNAWFMAAKNYEFKNSCYTCLLFSTCFVCLIYYVNILASVSKICKVSLCAVYSLIERMCSIYTTIIPIWCGNCILIYCPLTYFEIYPMVFFFFGLEVLWSMRSSITWEFYLWMASFDP